MKWKATPEYLRPKHFEIERDPFVGFYLYVFEDDKCTHDYLQDTLEIAIDCAWEDYGVSKDAWKKVE